MKKNNSRRSVIIAVLLFIGIVGIGLTAAAVYAGRVLHQEFNSFLSQVEPLTDEPTAQESSTQEDSSIYEKGVLVTAVEPDSPAQHAGIRRGTIILAVDGEEMSDLAHLIELLAAKGEGATVTLTVLNSPKPEEISVTLADAPPLLGVQIARALNELRLVPDSVPVGPKDFDFGQGAHFDGVLVAEVIEGSAAEEAGLKIGDTIEALNSRNITSVKQLAEQLGALTPGSSVTLSVVRDGEQQEITAILGEHPDQPGRGFLGILPAPPIQGFGPREGHKRFDPSETPFHDEFPTGGVVVMDVIEDSPAAAAGLQSGDIVEGLDGTTIATVDELIEIISSKEPGDMIRLSLNREGQQMEVEATLSANPDDASRAFLGVYLGSLLDAGREGLDKGDGVLPEEFFFRLHPDINPDELFDYFHGDFGEFMPHSSPKDSHPDLKEQDA